MKETPLPSTRNEPVFCFFRFSFWIGVVTCARVPVTCELVERNIKTLCYVVNGLVGEEYNFEKYAEQWAL